MVLASSAGQDQRPVIALHASARHETRLADLALDYRDVLAAHRLVATAGTARVLVEMAGLRVGATRCGIDRAERLGAEALAGVGVAAVILLVDPRSRDAQHGTLQPLVDGCSLRGIPFATNLATARAVLHMLSLVDEPRGLILDPCTRSLPASGTYLVSPPTGSTSTSSTMS